MYTVEICGWTVGFNQAVDFNRYSTEAVFLELNWLWFIVINYKLACLFGILRGILKSLQTGISRVMLKTLSYMSFPFLQPPGSKVKWNKRKWVGRRDAKGVPQGGWERDSEVGAEWKRRNKQGKWKGPDFFAGGNNAESMTDHCPPWGRGLASAPGNPHHTHQH
jgi:hypothetical protein